MKSKSKPRVKRKNAKPNGSRKRSIQHDEGATKGPARHTRTVVLDHISLPVRDLKKARTFYSAALGAIGMKINLDFSSACGLGSRDENIFWLTRDRQASGDGHYAFRVDHRDEVDAFHAAALAAGGKDHGKPGPRPNYGRRYYA